MRRTSVLRLLVVLAVTAALALALLRVAESRGAVLVPVPALAWAAILLIGVLVGVLGWNVRQYTRGRRPRMDLLLAARTVVLATASAYTGAVLSGWYAAQILVVVGDLHIDARRVVAVSAGVAALCALALAVVGLLVERWCEVPPPDDEGGVPTGISA